MTVVVLSTKGGNNVGQERGSWGNPPSGLWLKGMDPTLLPHRRDPGVRVGSVVEFQVGQVVSYDPVQEGRLFLRWRRRRIPEGRPYG